MASERGPRRLPKGPPPRATRTNPQRAWRCQGEVWVPRDIWLRERSARADAERYYDVVLSDLEAQLWMAEEALRGIALKTNKVPAHVAAGLTIMSIEEARELADSDLEDDE